MRTTEGLLAFDIHLRGILGVLLILAFVTSLSYVLMNITEKTARYDCYVWAFKHAECRFAQAGSSLADGGFCKEHLKPVERCVGLSETDSGIADAQRFMNGEQVEYPPDRDYRTFDVHPWSRSKQK